MKLHRFPKRITRMKVKLQVSKKMMELHEVVELQVNKKMMELHESIDL